MSSCRPENTIILTPCYHALERETLEGIQGLQARGWTSRVMYGHSAIDGARAQMASAAILEGYDYLFWIDADMVFTYRDFQQVAQGIDDFCCAPYMTKNPQGPLALLDFEEQTDRTTRGIKRIKASGFGFIKTPATIYRKMMHEIKACQNVPNGNAFWPFFQPRTFDVEDRIAYYGEDYSFCLWAEQLGFKLYANFDTEVGHIGRYAYRWKTDSPGPIRQLNMKVGESV